MLMIGDIYCEYRRVPIPQLFGVQWHPSLVHVFTDFGQQFVVNVAKIVRSRCQIWHLKCNRFEFQIPLVVGHGTLQTLAGLKRKGRVRTPRFWPKVMPVTMITCALYRRTCASSREDSAQSECAFCRCCRQTARFMVATHMEKLENPGNLKVIWEKSGKLCCCPWRVTVCNVMGTK